MSSLVGKSINAVSCTENKRQNVKIHQSPLPLAEQTDLPEAPAGSVGPSPGTAAEWGRLGTCGPRVHVVLFQEIWTEFTLFRVKNRKKKGRGSTGQ